MPRGVSTGSRARSPRGGYAPRMSTRSVITQTLDPAGRQRASQRRYTLAVASQPPRSFAAQSVTIGSSARNDVVIDDSTVSRHHARIEVRGTELALVDLGSTNGTWLDGVRITDAYLTHERAVITAGQARIELAMTSETEDVVLHDGAAFGRLRGRSFGMRRLFAMLARVAPTDASVLIEGESGTGKELVAEALHEHSRRADKPFVVVDCGSMPAALIESELFGHEKGAFTGAVQTRVGAFEMATGGTVFLDEIGELDLVLQPRLLRALESRQIKRVGGSQYKPIDVRVIAATNRDLATMVSSGDFREDLFHRLAVVEVRVPPLRERPEDIELLAQLFADEITEREPTIRRDALTPRMMAGLRARRWPGNVRELRNLIERVLILSGVLPEDAPEPAPEPAADSPMTWPYAVARAHVLEQFEREYVAAALDRAGGNVARAAREAKMERSYLFKLIRRLGLREGSRTDD